MGGGLQGGVVSVAESPVPGGNGGNAHAAGGEGGGISGTGALSGEIHRRVGFDSNAFRGSI